MACCLMAPSHYLNQWWLIITKVPWCSSEGDFAWDITVISSVIKISLKIIFLRFYWNLPGANELISDAWQCRITAIGHAQNPTLANIQKLWNWTELDAKHRKYASAPPSTFTPRRSPDNAWRPQIWPVSQSQRGTIIRKINRARPKSDQFWRWSGYISMQSFRPFPPCVLQEMLGNLSRRTNGWTDTPKKMVMFGQMDQRIHVQVERGYFRLWTEGQTDGWMDNQKT